MATTIRSTFFSVLGRAVDVSILRRIPWTKASIIAIKALWFQVRELEAAVQRTYSPPPTSPDSIKLLSFTRRRHIDLQRVASCLCLFAA